MHYYQFNIGDYAKATRHLSNLEDLAYRRLMEIYYDTENPLVDDVEKLARLINMRENKKEIEVVLSDFFLLTDEGFYQKRIDEEIQNYNAKADTARVNGKKGGRPKKANRNPEETKQEPKKTQPVILANPEETGSKANQEPITNNHKPITSLKPSCDVAIATPEKKKKFNDDDVRFAEWFYQGLLTNNPDHKKPNFETSSWADSVRLMREQDGRTYDQMASVFKWAASDSFWKSNILCPQKLRKQFDALVIKMEESTTNPRAQQGREVNGTNYAADLIEKLNTGTKRF